MTPDSTSVSTSARYVLDLCDRIAALTDVPGTTTRLFLSPATRVVHTLLTAEMHSLGMTVRTDALGNLRGRYAADEEARVSDPSQPHRNPLQTPTLLLGSHLDTVTDAGKYDGILGIALALGLIRALAGQHLPYALEVIAFSEEEGVRFRLPFLGSRALAGTLGVVELACTDMAGVSIAEAVRAFGLDPTSLADCAPTPGTFAYFEPHIEQGPELEAQSRPLGVVTAIAGQSRFSLTFTGQANHAGTTPMRYRSDALAAAAQWIVAVEALARETPGLVATTGVITAQPGAGNIIPGQAVVSLDVRHAEDKVRTHAVRRLLAKAESIARYRTLQVAGTPVTRTINVTAVETSVQKSVRMDSRLIALLQASAEATGHPYLTMASGAGHDAMIVAGVLPSAMLFLRTPGGLSHHPAESVRPEDVASALATSLAFLRALEPETFARK